MCRSRAGCCPSCSEVALGALVASPSGRQILGSLFDMIVHSNDGNVGKGGYAGGSAEGGGGGYQKPAFHKGYKK